MGPHLGRHCLDLRPAGLGHGHHERVMDMRGILVRGEVRAEQTQARCLPVEPEPGAVLLVGSRHPGTTIPSARQRPRMARSASATRLGSSIRSIATIFALMIVNATSVIGFPSAAVTTPAAPLIR